MLKIVILVYFSRVGGRLCVCVCWCSLFFRSPIWFFGLVGGFMFSIFASGKVRHPAIYSFNQSDYSIKSASTHAFLLSMIVLLSSLPLS